jgi:glutaconate CoA-transferase, subunit B
MTQLAAPTYTADEMMAVAAARRLRDGTVCFVGIGLPSLAANLARATHAPSCVLVYESGAIGAKPAHLPLSIGDGELAETADAVVSVPEIFSYWLQGGRIDVGFLGAAQIDRFGNLNSTVIGDYDEPRVRLPGAGGAPEIAAWCRETFVMLKHSPRTFVRELDFRTTAGAGVGGAGVTCVVTDLGVLEPDETGELALAELHPGVTEGEVREATGWELRVAEPVRRSAPPTGAELRALRALEPANGETSAA